MSTTLAARTRTAIGKQVKSLLGTGKIPAVIYGKHVPATALELDEIAFKKAYQSAGESTLIDVQIDDKQPMKALIHDMDIDPASQRLRHVDLLAVNLKEKLRAEVPLQFVGESKAVKELGGTLVKNNDKIEVECFPSELVHEVVIDVSLLSTFDARITVGDITPPTGITFTAKPEEVIAFVEEPRSEKELEELESKVEDRIQEVEVEEKGKEEEEAAEGESEEKAKAPETKKKE